MAGVYMHSPFTMCGPELSTSVITRPREVKNSFNFSRHRGMGLSSTTISNSRPLSFAYQVPLGRGRQTARGL